MEKYQLFEQHMRKLADVGHAIGVLSWDKEVNLPPAGAAFRSQQVATLSGIAHELLTDEQLGAWLEELNGANGDLSAEQRRNVELTLKDYRRSQKLDKEFVVRRSQMESRAYHAWKAAREANDFSGFAEPFAELIDIKREEADLLGYEEHPYDALLDLYEPEYRASKLDRLFADVRRQLVDFARELRQQPQVDNRFMSRHYPKDRQWEFGLHMLRVMGYDFNAGRQDLSTHPFTINFSPQDVRVTTRIDEHDLGNMTWSCIHEGGHALYEQGLPAQQYGMPLGSAVSLGIHESQSRLWENHVARSLPFWKAHYPTLQEKFPESLSDIHLDQFYRGINKIEPNLIRTEADELHYHFHVLIRYEIEKALMEGSIKVKDIRDAWNDKYQSYLGLTAPDDRQGILQDIHWSHGSIGYFPTYSLGSFYAAQFYAQAQKAIPQLEDQLASGATQPLLDWLRRNIHQYGRYYTADELCEKVTGEKLDFRFFMEYARNKFSRVYDL